MAPSLDRVNMHIQTNSHSLQDYHSHEHEGNRICTSLLNINLVPMRILEKNKWLKMLFQSVGSKFWLVLDNVLELGGKEVKALIKPSNFIDLIVSFGKHSLYKCALFSKA